MAEEIKTRVNDGLRATRGCLLFLVWGSACAASALQGFVDVTSRGADPTGVQDSTEAIQTAIYDAWNGNQAVYFPTGTYTVSNTLYCCQPFSESGTRRRGHTLVGAYDRPLIKLADSAPGFSDSGNPMPLFVFWRSAISEDITNTNFNSRVDNENYNQVIRNLRINLGAGNPGAAAIRMRGAEGCAVQDVRIAAYGSFCGLWQLNGSGGGNTGIWILGGRYGIYATGAQPCPVVAGAYFEKQSEAAVYYNAGTPLTLVGFHVKRFHDTPVFDGLWQGTGQRSSQEYWAMLNLVDGRVEYDGEAAVCLAHKDRPLYLRNVYFKGYSRIIDNTSPGDARDIDADPLTWTHVAEFADSPALTRDLPRLLDGIKTYDAVAELRRDVPEPDVDFIGRHVWTYGLGCADREGVVNVTDYGAVGDAAADDTAAIQAAVDDANLVYVPPGGYRISGTIQLKGNTELFGVARDKCYLTSAGFSAQPTLTPMVFSPDNTDATTAISSLKFLFKTPEKNVYPLLWQAGRRSVIRDVWPYPLEGPSAPMQRI